jgi:hypothetical protein
LEWTRLRPLLGLTEARVPDLVELPIASKVWHAVGGTHDSPPERTVAARLYAPRKSFGALVDKALLSLNRREDHRVCHRFLELARPESGHEVLFWLLLLAAGAKPCRLSPAKAGFRRLSVVDSATKNLRGDLRLACLELEGPGYRLLFFPQVTLDTRKSYFRLDALVCLRRGRTRFWFDLEVDGQGHDPRFDLEREGMIGLPTVRIDTHELETDPLAALDQKLAPLLGVRQAC